ncbi:hypothetical protein CKO42_04205 [Lamprobacter modestohalophilus]|uniref:DUF3320 domain-containing protein n=1 Tax=Lamprobacter modestohalophilus TaxID=1064514 RepID=A0A9X0W6G1_9GAMM|nr:DUF3320 domain-containing protein [Lamprobacter modestohalophilus]MBK1617666.1 hypothetical protein [Lamprobacter modestohalophilus]
MDQEVNSANINRLTQELKSARRRLIETGTRNRLIHVNRKQKRSKSLNIINEQADKVYEILHQRGRPMRFKASATEQIDESQVLNGHAVALSEDTEEDTESEARFSGAFLKTELTVDALQKRLLGLYRDARTAEEEQGINILYLAIGFMCWFEDERSQVQREAPLILIPVELVRNKKTGHHQLQVRDEDMSTNLPLRGRLETDFGIPLPMLDETVSDQAAGEDSENEWRPSAYFEQVSRVIANQPRWSIDADGMQLGFFSFAKLLMMHDLEPDRWSSDQLASNSILKGLLKDGFEPTSPLFSDGERLDTRLDPADLLHVIDADASQTKVIEEVSVGRNIVVQGPPGTGKSQTITNLIAKAVHDGKTVLFMAEKMAALNVVHRRMQKLGLADLCLELHSRQANKKVVLQELKRTLQGVNHPCENAADGSALRDCRDELNVITENLHAPLSGRTYSPFESMAEVIGFLGRELQPPVVQNEALCELSDEERMHRRTFVQQYVAARKTIGAPSTHPFCGVQRLDLQPVDQQRLKQELATAVGLLDAFGIELDRVASVLAVPSPNSLNDTLAFCSFLSRLQPDAAAQTHLVDALFSHLDELRLLEGLEAGAAWRRNRDTAAAGFKDAAWYAEVEALRGPIAKGVSSGFSRLFGRYRSASRELRVLLKGPPPKAPSERLELVDQLLQVQEQRALLSEDEDWLRRVLGDAWRGERTDFQAALATLKWLRALAETGWLPQEPHTLCSWVADLPEAASRADQLAELLKKAEDAVFPPLKRLEYSFEGLSEDASTTPLANSSLSELLQRLRNMLAHLDSYVDWAHYIQSRQQLEEVGLQTLLEALDNQDVALASALDEFDYAVAEARWNYARAAQPELAPLAACDRHKLVEQFQTLDAERVTDVRALIRNQHRQQLPTGATGEMGFLRGEMAKRRRHRSIRQIMINAGRMVQRIKPVFLMSPISIAQFLPPEQMSFDLLIIDEASQIKPEDAIGAMARARQIVVVGDSKQLPPSSFFDRLTDEDGDEDEEEDGTAPMAQAIELESILTLCEARGLRRLMLEWHYRSRDPSLITVSNAEFYENRLILLPTPTQHDDNIGLQLTRVPGVYSSKSRGGGRPGTNRIEAEAIVNALSRHARHAAEFSVGVVTFSKAQSDMVTELLELRRREDSLLDALLREGRTEDVFVKNIENVQGDERDVIMISVGYGPHEPNGRLSSMNFGPVNTDGGERRLNVLFSRARIRCQVFASFAPEEIDLSRTTKDGPRVLKRFLKFAETGELEQALPTGADADSPFEEDVANVITTLGYQCDAQVGSAGFRIDLGVRNPDRPGQYILAVECDGATYHRALWARERDRLRQQVLEGLGWRFHRIWSTDWFYRRDQEVARLKEVLRDAHFAADSWSIEGANQSVFGQFGQKDIFEGLPENDDPRNPAQPWDDSVSAEANLAVPTSLQTVPYQRAIPQIGINFEPHEMPIETLAEHVSTVVEAEGPIHTVEVARRIAVGCGKTRTGIRIQDATRAALVHAQMQDRMCRDEEFWFTAAQQNDPPVRDRSQESLPTNKAIYLSNLEIQAAAVIVKRENGRVDPEECIQAVARLLGFQRTGAELHEKIEQALGD